MIRHPLEAAEALEAYKRSINKPSRYRAHGTRDTDGTFFHSKGELRRWQELQMLQTAGEIFKLERQVRHALEVNGALVGHFTPDFRYIERSGEVIIEDFKSPASAADEAYRLRRKMFEALYPYVVRETMRTRR